MKKLLLCAFCWMLFGTGLAFAQDKMVITFKDGRVQAIDISSILKIEYQTGQSSRITGEASPPLHGRTASFLSFNYRTHYVRHANFLGELTPVSSDLDRKDSIFKIVPGLADSQNISFESVNYPGHYLRHQDYRIKLNKFDGSQLFKADATFKVQPGLADGAWSSFESVNYPGHYIRHKSFHLYIEKGNDDLFRKDATFRVMGPTF